MKALEDINMVIDESTMVVVCCFVVFHIVYISGGNSSKFVTASTFESRGTWSLDGCS